MHGSITCSPPQPARLCCPAAAREPAPAATRSRSLAHRPGTHWGALTADGWCHRCRRCRRRHVSYHPGTLAFLHSRRLLHDLPLVQVHVQQPGGHAPQVGNSQPHQPQSERIRRLAGKRGCAGGPAASVVGPHVLRCSFGNSCGHSLRPGPCRNRLAAQLLLPADLSCCHLLRFLPSLLLRLATSPTRRMHATESLVVVCNAACRGRCWTSPA